MTNKAVPLLLSALLTWLPPALAETEAREVGVEVHHVRKVFDDGRHNAFTDLAVFQNAFYLAFRTCPDGHGVSPNASIVVLRSEDTREWTQVHTFRVAQRDTRDPHFLVFRGMLFVYTGTWFSGDQPARNNRDLEMNLHLGYAAWTGDGTTWSGPRLLEGTFGHYVWRAGSFGKKAYLCARRKTGFAVGAKGEPDEIQSLMLESDDGLIWRKRAIFQETMGAETAFLFDRRGAVLGIGRRRGTAQLLRSEPPYKHWDRSDLDRHLGGPLLVKWGGRTVVGGRRSTPNGPRTSLAWLEGDKLVEFAELPSGGDNSYPGFVAISPSEALVSWYSSHQGTASIYLADLKLSTNLEGFDRKQRDAVKRGDSILSFQRANGGFSRHRKSSPPPSFEERLRNRFARELRDTMFDNGATHRQIRELAACYSDTRVPRFRHGCEAGIEFLLEAQYPNGGWPQRFPEPSGYARHITFNDDAMIGVLGVLHDVAQGGEPFEWIGETLRKRADEAVRRGIQCILNCQVMVAGTRTAWGQQHDEVTLAPRPARTFEPAALCTAESVGIVEFLMSLEQPDPQVIGAIESAVAWMDGPARLEGIRQERNGGQGKRVVEDPSAPPLWARLYEIETNRPIFGDRDGKVYYRLADISEERRNGYSWYVNSPAELIEEKYPKWRKRLESAEGKE